jgi:hypothetical protein
MKWVILALAALGLVFLGLSVLGYRHDEQAGQSADVRMGNMIPGAIGVVLLIIAAILLLVAGAIKLISL